jgi:hypothetical protein
MNTEQKYKYRQNKSFDSCWQHEGDVVASLEPAASRLSRRRRFAALEPRPGYARVRRPAHIAPACTVLVKHAQLEFLGSLMSTNC